MSIQMLNALLVVVTQHEGLHCEVIYNNLISLRVGWYSVARIHKRAGEVETKILERVSEERFYWRDNQWQPLV